VPQGRENDPVFAVCNVKALQALIAKSESRMGRKLRIPSRQIWAAQRSAAPLHVVLNNYTEM